MSLFLGVVYLFQPCFSLPFVSLDDPNYLGGESLARFGVTYRGLLFSLTSTNQMYWHPVTWFSYMLDAEWFGLSTLAVHRTNVILHCVTATLVAALLARLVGSWGYGILAALLWAIHPLRVESVAWAAERKDVLSGVFFASALLAHSDCATPARRWRSGITLILGCLAMMSKPTTVILPVIMVLIDKWRDGDKWNWRRTPIHVPLLLGTSVAVSAITVLGQSSVGALGLVSRPIGVRFANALLSVATYFYRIVRMGDLACYYPYPSVLSSWALLGSGILVAGLVVASWRLRTTRPYLCWGLSFYFVALLPTLGLVQAGRQANADRFTYLPMIGLAWTVAGLARDQVGEWIRKPALVSMTILVIVGLLVHKTRVQIETWRSNRLVFQAAADAGSRDGFVLGNLGAALMAEGRNGEAVSNLREAARLEPDQAVHWRNLGWALARTGDLNSAWKASEILLTQLPESPEGHLLQGRLAISRRDFPMAIACLTRAMSFGWPARQTAVLVHDAGITLAREGQLQQALNLIQQAVIWQPDTPEFRRSLAQVSEDLKGRADLRFESAKPLVSMQPVPLRGHLP